MAISRNAFSKLVEALCQAKVTIFSDRDCITWLICAKNGWQIALMWFKRNSISDEFHINDFSQWGVIIAGEMLLWISNKRKRLLRRGDTFFIPEGIPHRVAIKAGYKDITIFNGRRYNLKTLKKKGGEKCGPKRKLRSRQGGKSDVNV